MYLAADFGGLHDPHRDVYKRTTPMRYVKPSRILAGFHADDPAAGVPELVHVGEQWAAGDYPIPRHRHAVWEFYLQLDGFSLWEDARGGRYRCPAGAFYAPPPGLEHWLVRASRDRHHFFFAAVDVKRVVEARLPTLAKAWRNAGTLHRTAARSVEASFRQLVRECTVARPFRDEGVRAALDALVIDATRLLAATNPAGTPIVPGHPAVERARAALEAHPAQPWRLADLGKLTGLSPNHLARLFTGEVGVSPRAYLAGQRIALAKDLLRRTDLPVTQVALDLGFASSQHFARAFRTATGRTATRYRVGR
jgi:AraC-like DNA-binding protein